MIVKANDTRTRSSDAQEQLRRRVVAAIRDGGMTKAQAARAFRVSRTSINAWLNACAARVRRPASGKSGRKPVSRLKPHQAATVTSATPWRQALAGAGLPGHRPTLRTQYSSAAEAAEDAEDAEDAEENSAGAID
jgi:hypothetical protein